MCERFLSLGMLAYELTVANVFCNYNTLCTFCGFIGRMHKRVMSLNVRIVPTLTPKKTVFNSQILSECTHIVLADACYDVITVRPLSGMFVDMLPVKNCIFSVTTPTFS